MKFQPLTKFEGEGGEFFYSTGFYCEMYHFNVVVIWPCNKTIRPKTAVDFMVDQVRSETYDPGEVTQAIGARASTYLFETKENGKCFFIPIYELKDDISDITVFSHECNHVAEWVFECIGTTHNKETSEPYCYLQEYIMKNLLIAMTFPSDSSKS